MLSRCLRAINAHKFPTWTVRAHKAFDLFTAARPAVSLTGCKASKSSAPVTSAQSVLKQDNAEISGKASFDCLPHKLRNTLCGNKSTDSTSIVTSSKVIAATNGSAHGNATTNNLTILAKKRFVFVGFSTSLCRIP